MAIIPNFQFRPTIIPKDNSLVLNQFNKTADRLDQKFQENLDFADRLTLFANSVKVGVGDSDIKENAVGNINNLINRIQEENIGFENSTLSLRAAARDFSSNQELQAAQNNFLLEEETRKREDLLRAQGKLSFASDTENFKTVTIDDRGKRVINTFSPTGEVTLDHFNDAKRHIGTLKSNLKSLGIEPVFKKGFPVDFIKQGTRESITNQDLLNRVNEVVDEFLQSSNGGNQFARLEEQKLRQQFPDATDTQIQLLVKESAENLLNAAGDDQIFEKERISFSESRGQLALLSAGLKGKGGNGVSRTIESGASVKPNTILKGTNAFKVTKDGNIKVGENELNLLERFKEIDIIKKTTDKVGKISGIGATGTMLIPVVAGAVGVGIAIDAAMVSIGSFIAPSVLRFAAKVEEFFGTDELTLDELVKTEDGQQVFEVLKRSRLADETTPPNRLQSITKKFLEDDANSSINFGINVSSNITDPNNTGLKLTQEELDKKLFQPEKAGRDNAGVPTLNGSIKGMMITNITPGGSKAGHVENGTDLLKRAIDEKLVLSSEGTTDNNQPYSAGAIAINDDKGNKYIASGFKEDVNRNHTQWSFNQINFSKVGLYTFIDNRTGNTISIKRDVSTMQLDQNGNIIGGTGDVIVTVDGFDGILLKPDGTKPNNTDEAWRLYQAFINEQQSQ